MKAKKEISILLHNIRSVHNVGSIFRTADALGVDKVYLSGFTPTPENKFGQPRRDFSKVSLGAEKTIVWEYIENPKTFIKKLNKYQIIGIEQTKNSIDYKKVKIKPPVLFIMGSEVEGIDKNFLSLCDVVAEISMKGRKESLNVSVAFGVALFRILNI